MSEKKTAQGVLVRRVQFAFLENFKPQWHPAKPELSQFANRRERQPRLSRF
ncbi:MAG: hypothetical protein HY268_00320 [Deltaproteobacteria bacterium]|nr:hypothetical protein [Deltaproteobacteria bacterium]